MKTKIANKEEIRESVRIYTRFLHEYLMRIRGNRIIDGKNKINFENNTIKNIND